MATGTIKNHTVQDISSEFTYNLSSGTHFILAMYDPASKVVFVSFSVVNASAFGTGTNIYNIPSAYTPKSSGHIAEGTDHWKAGGVVQTTSGVYTGIVEAGTYGGIRQVFSSQATGCSGALMWKVQ